MGSPTSSPNAATASPNADWMTSGRGQFHGAKPRRGIQTTWTSRPFGGRAGERGGITGRGPGLHGEQESQVRDRRREWAVGRVIDPVRNRLPGDQAR
jgi:hypothetical protein